MLVAATTVKDTVAHLERYVRGNLAGGLDHLVVFLDAPGAEGQAEAREFLDARARVTCVPAGRGWWGEARPTELNERQCTNANVVKHVLAEIGLTRPEDWIFHIDGDEVVRIDGAALGAVPPGRAAVQLAVREVVSREEWPGVPNLFKHLLGEAELSDLHQRGLIAEPDNRAYFHGHLQGKAGVRVGAPGWLTLHRVVDADGAVVAGESNEAFEVFHFESYSAEEFLRKWTAIVESGPRAAHRPGRAGLAREIAELVRSDLAPDERRERLLALYRSHVADDVTTLSELGLLSTVDVLARGTQERAFDLDAVTALEGGLETLRGQPKADFFRGASTKNGRALGGRTTEQERRRFRTALRRARRDG